MNRLNRLPVLAGLLLAVIALTFAALTPHRAHAEHNGPLQPSASATLNVTKAEHPTLATYSATLNWTTGRHRPAGGTDSSALVYAPPSKYQYHSTTVVITHSGTGDDRVTTTTGDTPPTDGWTDVSHVADQYNYSATFSNLSANTRYALWVRSCDSSSVCSPALATGVVTPPQRPGPLNFFNAWPYQRPDSRRGFGYTINPPDAPHAELNNYEYEFQVRYGQSDPWRYITTRTNTSGTYNGRVVSITPQGRVYDFDSNRAFQVRVRAANESGWSPWSFAISIAAPTTDQATSFIVQPEYNIRLKELGRQYDGNRNNTIQSGELNRALDDYRAGRIVHGDAVKVINLYKRQIRINQIQVP